MTMVCFSENSQLAQAFTVDSEGSPVFTIKLLDDELYFLGDKPDCSRIIAKWYYSKKNKSGQILLACCLLRPIKHTELSWTSAEFVFKKTYKLWNFTFEERWTVILKISNFPLLLECWGIQMPRIWRFWNHCHHLWQMSWKANYFFWGSLVNTPNTSNAKISIWAGKPQQQGLVKYFSSDHFRGIGVKTLLKIVNSAEDTEDTIDKILAEPATQIKTA